MWDRWDHRMISRLGWWVLTSNPHGVFASGTTNSAVSLQNRWPPGGGNDGFDGDGFRRTMEDYHRACHGVCIDVLVCIAATLSEEERVQMGAATADVTCLASLHTLRDDVLELKRYPPLESELCGEDRITPHADLTTLSILSSDAAGFLTVNGEEWAEVEGRVGS
eukprot:Hpha_TRINITY_DN5676_c0_g1::TRINITY_DN5676_c0_g1_i1::g.50679::m.50679